MSLPPLASLDDLEVRLPDHIEGNDVARAEAALIDASALVRTEAGKTWANDDGDELVDVPDIIVTITVAVARRGFLNPEGYQQETSGDHTVMLSSSIYLLDDEKALIATTTTSTSGLFTISTTRSDSDFGCVYYDVEGGDSIPPTPWGSGW